MAVNGGVIFCVMVDFLSDRVRDVWLVHNSLRVLSEVATSFDNSLKKLNLFISGLSTQE